MSEDEKDMAGESTPEEALEVLSLFWPSFFAEPAAAPPMPRVELSQVTGVETPA